MTTVSYNESEWHKLISAGGDSKVNIPVWFTVKGNSMYPFIRNRKDSVLIYPVEPDELKIGDIVFFGIKEKKGEYCLHRLYKIDGERVQTFGDGNTHPDGWIHKSDIIGKVTLIQRGKREIRCDDPKWIKRFERWTSLRKIRGVLLLPVKTGRKAKSAVRRLSKGFTGLFDKNGRNE